jgi:monoamine oxidase
MSTPYAVIIGGGFAGVTAARELSMRGRTTVLVEARDRLGGRAYTASHDGYDMELGGARVHPFQPNVWAEITRHSITPEYYSSS